MDDESLTLLIGKSAAKRPREKKAKGVIAPSLPHLKDALQAGLVGDPFWLSLLTDVSEGKMPKGFRVKGTTIFYRNRTKMFSVDLPDSASLICPAIIDFFRNAGGVKSELDILREQESKEQFRENEEEKQNNWKANKQKRMREMYVRSYCSSLRNSLSLTDRQHEQLLDLLLRSLLLGELPTDSVTLENNRIKEISGLMLNEQTGFFYLSRKKEKKFKRPVINSVSQFFIPIHTGRRKTVEAEWEKFVSDLDKKDRKLKMLDSDDRFEATPVDPTSLNDIFDAEDFMD